MEATNLADLYDLGPVEWSRIETRLRQGVTQAPGTGGPDRHTCWLATINAEGGPHVTGIGAIWHDGSFWFETGGQTRKGRNLARDPRCSLSVATDQFDLVAEGRAHRVAVPRRRHRPRADRRVQRPVSRAAAVVRVPARCPGRDRAADHRARWRDPLAILTVSRQRPAQRHVLVQIADLEYPLGDDARIVDRERTTVRLRGAQRVQTSDPGAVEGSNARQVEHDGTGEAGVGVYRIVDA
jgi:Pyridoxamine 5'-phosphate oxidase